MTVKYLPTEQDKAVIPQSKCDDVVTIRATGIKLIIGPASKRTIIVEKCSQTKKKSEE